jgi:predicted dehydrogenase
MQAPRPNRRTFLMHTAAAGAAVASLDVARNAFAGGDDLIRVGLVGCGGRGTGAAEQNLTADPNVKLVAMADAFADRLEGSLNELKSSPVSARVEVDEDHRFVGFDAYKDLIDAVDVVILATPPGFRPIHFAHAVEKNKHVFVEKPMAVDGPGLRQYLEAARHSVEKGLSAVNGFCWRYHNPRRETMKRVFDGQIGDIVSIETTYNSQGVWEPRKAREECGSDMEYQMRNWYYYDWLSGDHIVEQAVHGIDTMAWAMGDKPPQKCWGVGGRQVRTAERYGNIYDHFGIVYEYEGGVRGYHQCRHWPGTPTQVKDYILGAKGVADVFGNRIDGAQKWRYRGENNNMYQTEHDEMYAALRAGKPLNNAERAGLTTLLALMGRMAAYTGEVVTWEQMMNSETRLVPDQFAWGDAPDRPVPIPGTTKFA